MRSDLIIILSTILIFGAFILFKGLQENLSLSTIFAIFIEFSGFLIGFMLICISLSNFINWIFNNIQNKI